MIDKRRVLKEINHLEDLCQRVAFNPEQGRIELEQVPFPPGWSPRHGNIRIVLPETYPGGQPEVYMQDHMRYKGKKPHIMLRGPSGWSKHCIHELDIDPEFNTLVSLMRLVVRSLRHPTKKNPIKHR